MFIPNLLLSLTEWILALLISLVYYRSSVLKIRNPFSFFKVVVEDYQLFNLRLSIRLVPLYIAFEGSVVLLVLFPQTRIIGVFIGIGIQVMLIFILMKRLGETLEHGCGCFTLDTPSIVSKKHILVNILMVSILLLLLLFCY